MTETLYREMIDTPVGKLVCVSSSTHLISLEYDKPKRLALLSSRLKRYRPMSQIKVQKSEIGTLVRNWLKHYFSGQFEKQQSIPLEHLGTSFELSVWKEMKKIKRGLPITYKTLAQRAGNPKGARAAGGASRRNPICIIVPCHRVIGSSGSLTGYGGGLDQKDWLLKHELDS